MPLIVIIIIASESTASLSSREGIYDEMNVAKIS